MTYEELLQSGIQQLGFNKKKDVEDLLCYSAKITLAELLANKNKEVGDVAVNIYHKALDEYVKGKPLAYITHNACFYGYDFFVNEGCLIPRVDSEVLIENALRNININQSSPLNILDACCGSGCLGITLTNELAKKNIKSILTLIDKSTSAMQVAKINCEKHNIRAKYIIADVLSYGFGEEKYDIIICNPPYIENEPRIALDGGEDGAKFYRFLSKKVKQSLTHSGFAIFEIGYNQGKTARDIFLQQHLSVDVIKDYGKNDRVLLVK